MSVRTSRLLINTISLLGVVAMIGLTIYWWQLGSFRNMTVLRRYVAAQQLAGPIVFLLIQIVQVAIPIIPGGISLAAGVLLFGPQWGFVYNYIGIVLGSFISFFLARRYGQRFVRHVVPPKAYDHYIKRTQHQRQFNRFFAAAILLPMLPDDILVMLAGLTKMRWSRFAVIILTLKPFTILAYSYALVYGSQWLLSWLP